LNDLLFCNCECKYRILSNINQNFLRNLFCIFESESAIKN